MTRDLERRFPPERDAPAAAREALEEFADRLPFDLMDSLRLLVSELVTNSYRHARLDPSGWIGLRAELYDDRIRVEVSDPGPGFDADVPSPSLYQESGWGLYLVRHLADRWGVHRGRQTTVWFEMDLPE